MCSMQIVGRLVGKVDTRLLVSIGILLSAVSPFAMSMYNLSVSPFWFIWPIVIGGFGLGMIYVPLSAASLTTLKPRQMADAAGMFSLLRTVGSSVGISIVSTLHTRLGQMEWNQLGGHMTYFSPALTHYMAAHGLTWSNPFTIHFLALTLERQSQMLALTNVMRFIAWSFLAMLPFVLLVRDVKSKRKPAPIVVE